VDLEAASPPDRRNRSSKSVPFDLSVATPNDDDDRTATPATDTRRGPNRLSRGKFRGTWDGISRAVASYRSATRCRHARHRAARNRQDHLVIERICHLVATGNAPNPQEQILVLSFTRSAVAEVRKRLRAMVDSGAHPDVAYARVLTFDSLATRLMIDDAGPDFLTGVGYGDRIRWFNGLIGKELPVARTSSPRSASYS